MTAARPSGFVSAAVSWSERSPTKVLAPSTSAAAITSTELRYRVPRQQPRSRSSPAVQASVPLQVNAQYSLNALLVAGVAAVRLLPQVRLLPVAEVVVAVIRPVTSPQYRQATTIRLAAADRAGQILAGAVIPVEIRLGKYQ